MALNRYTTSSRFSDTTTNVPIPSVIGYEGAEERNAAKLAEYQRQVRDRNSNMSRERGRLATIAKKQKLLKQHGGSDYDPAAMSQRFAADENMVRMSPESVKEFNRRNREEGAGKAPEVTELYRPKIGTYNRMPYADDQAFMDENFNREKKITTNYGPVYRTDFGDTTEKTFAEIPYPNLESERLERIATPARRGEVPSIIDNRERQGEYVEPLGPGGVEYVKGTRSEKTGTAKQRRQNLADRIFRGGELKTGKIEGQKGYFKNLGERRRFRKEGKLAKAAFGRGFNEMDSQERADRKKMLKEDRRDFIGAAFRRPGQGGLAAARDTGREIRDINRAEKYSERRLGFGPEIKDYTPKVMKNYRSSEDNPLNRNRRSI